MAKRTNGYIGNAYEISFQVLNFTSFLKKKKFDKNQIRKILYAIL